MKDCRGTRDAIDRPLIVPFPGSVKANPADVGGKGASLLQMSEAGLPVPSGAVLTTTFFASWFDEIASSVPWAELTEAPPDDWASLCSELKELGRSLPLTRTQHDALAGLRRALTARSNEVSLAVRSSSPEEDGMSASFAGLYETRLGVSPGGLQDAVRDCFVSALDVRVLTYRNERGCDVWSPQLAVVVQRQVDSEVAGVAFSLNPVTNDYDEAVIDANWGLGTSVVEGRVDPDHFVVNKVERQVVERSRGDKQVSIQLQPDGSIIERRKYRSGECTLSDAQLAELTDVIGRIEALYDAPVDIEWAYSDATLHVLQARPITTWVPLPPEMVTPPRERRRLYADASLSKGLTINKPVSPLGLDAVERMFSSILESWIGPWKRDVTAGEALHIFAGGRMYMNLSNLMWFASPGMMSRSSAPNDVLMAEILASVDAKQYRAVTRPPWMSFRLLWLIPRVLWNLRGFFWNALRAIVSPESAHRAYQQRIDSLATDLRVNIDDDLPLNDLRRRYEIRMAREFPAIMSALLAGMVSPNLVIRRKTASERALTDKLRRGVTGNVVVEMGIALHRLSKLLDPSEFEDLPQLAQRIEHRQVSPALLSAWDDFLMRFGCRGPLETDIANPRYADDPTLALRQMSFMAIDDGFDPEAAHQRRVEERHQAYQELMRRSGPLRRALLRRIYRLNDLFAGSRDTPKHLAVLSNYVIRRRTLKEGRCLTQVGRLDAPEHVFDLTFDDLRSAAEDATLDLRKVREERSRFRRKLEAHVRSFPPVIDSRGRILRPPAVEHAPGLLTGMAVSPGVVTGPAKILRTPHEKCVEKGDVLVAYTTDPGWTPLFVNAAAIVLEVGGALQHGAVVAREYGKPCVVGIDRVVTKLRDGEAVEVNGTAGTVRLLS